MRHGIALALVLVSTQAFAGGISVPRDEVRTVTFTKPVATVYVGNPVIADISMIDSRHAFLLGKSFGVTNIVALDAAGHEVSDVPVTVSASRGSTVTLNKGSTQITLACASGHCETTPLPGDVDFKNTTPDIEKHIDLGTKPSP